MLFKWRRYVEEADKENRVLVRSIVRKNQAISTYKRVLIDTLEEIQDITNKSKSMTKTQIVTALQNLEQPMVDVLYEDRGEEYIKG